MDDPISTELPVMEPFDEIEFQVAEAVADIEAAEREGRASPLEAWVERYPEAAERIREAVTSCNLVESAIETAGLRISVSPEPPPTEFPPPELEDFEVRQVMASGAMGVVYEAVQKSTRRRVALKTLPQALLPNVRRRRLFEREVEAVAALHHPNIVPIFWSGLDKGQYYFAMQFIQGVHLDEYVRNLAERQRQASPVGKRHERVPVREILRLMAKVCDAVQYAHLKGVIHRDLKPSNILVDANGEPHLLDFGLAKTLALNTQEAVESALSLGGQVFGTLPYLAPEQARGESEEIDVRTDVYALGVVLYKLLTDRYPYPVKGPLGHVLDNIQNTDPKRAAKSLVERGFDAGFARRTINDELETIVMTALSKRKDDRYQSAADLGDDIRHLLTGEPIEAKLHARWRYILRKYVERNAFQITLVALVIFLAVALAWRLRTEHDPNPTITIDQTTVKQLEEWQRTREEAAPAALADDRIAMARGYLAAQIRLCFSHWQHDEATLIADELRQARELLWGFLRSPESTVSFETLLYSVLDELAADYAEPESQATFQAFRRGCLEILGMSSPAP